MNGVPKNRREELVSELEGLGFDLARKDDWRSVMTDDEPIQVIADVDPAVERPFACADETARPRTIEEIVAETMAPKMAAWRNEYRAGHKAMILELADRGESYMMRRTRHLIGRTNSLDDLIRRLSRKVRYIKRAKWYVPGEAACRQHLLAARYLRRFGARSQSAYTTTANDLSGALVRMAGGRA